MLAVLGAAAGEPVSVDALVDRVWGDRLPLTAAATLHSYLSRLRGRLKQVAGDDTRLERPSPRTYRLRIAPEAVDLTRFRQLRGQARQTVAGGAVERAVDQLREAEGRRTAPRQPGAMPSGPSRSTRSWGWRRKWSGCGGHSPSGSRAGRLPVHDGLGELCDCNQPGEHDNGQQVSRARCVPAARPRPPRRPGPDMTHARHPVDTIPFRLRQTGEAAWHGQPIGPQNTPVPGPAGHRGRRERGPQHTREAHAGGGIDPAGRRTARGRRQPRENATADPAWHARGDRGGRCRPARRRMRR